MDKLKLYLLLFYFRTNKQLMHKAKTAHVDVSEIMTKMPAMLDAQKQLDKLSTTYDADYKMVEEYQN
jgi:outer membrane protein